MFAQVDCWKLHWKLSLTSNILLDKCSNMLKNPFAFSPHRSHTVELISDKKAKEFRNFWKWRQLLMGHSGLTSILLSWPKRFWSFQVLKLFWRLVGQLWQTHAKFQCSSYCVTLVAVSCKTKLRLSKTIHECSPWFLYTKFFGTPLLTHDNRVIITLATTKDMGNHARSNIFYWFPNCVGVGFWELISATLHRLAEMARRATTHKRT